MENYFILKLRNNSLFVNKHSGWWRLISNDIVKKKDEVKKILFRDEKYKTNIIFYEKNNKLVLILKITEKCNLNCTYCYQRNEKRIKTLDEKNIKRLTNCIKEMVYSYPDIEISLEFTGGEPLLEFGVIQDIVYKLKEINCKIKRKCIKTNGTIFSEKIADYLRKNNFLLCFSLDGTEETNDLHRKYIDGRGTFKVIMNNYSRYLNHGMKYISNISVITKTEQFSEIFDLFQNYNFRNIKINPLSYNDTIDSKFQEELAKYHINFIKRMLDRKKFFGLSTFKRILLKILNLEKYSKLNPCPSTLCHAGIDMIAIDPDLNCYPCLEFEMFKEFKIGNLHKQNILIEIKQKDLRHPKILARTIESIPKCKECIFKFFCGGDCSARSYAKFGDMQSESDNCIYYYYLYKGIFELLDSEYYSNKVIKYMKKYLQGAKNV